VPYRACLFDLDGTLYLGDALLPAAAQTLHALRARGMRTLFLSNNPTRTPADYAEKLTRLGIPAHPADVLTSSRVMADFLQRELPGARLFVAGEPPLKSELVRAGFIETADPQSVDAVIASFDRTFTYAKLQTAFDAIRRGARFFATNADPYCPIPGGGEPDAAAVIAAIEACTGKQVEAVVGKPSKYMIAAALAALGLPASQCLMIGDRLETDVQMGINAGMDTALVLTGATRAADLAASPIQPTCIWETLAGLLETLKNS
jgi:NagD protein